MLFIFEEKDGWFYGEYDVFKVRGWFLLLYIKLLEENEIEVVIVFILSFVLVRSVSIVNLFENSSVVIFLFDYLECLFMGVVVDRRVDVVRMIFIFKVLVFKFEIIVFNDVNGIVKLFFFSGENFFVIVKFCFIVMNDCLVFII